MNHLKLINADDLLLHQTNPKLIESQLIDYIMSLRQDGVAYSTIKFLVAPIFTFYQLNDLMTVFLTWVLLPSHRIPFYLLVLLQQLSSSTRQG